MQVEWIHFPLHPDTPAQGRSLQELFAGRGYDIPKMQAQMRARMAAEGLPYGERTMTFNSRLAQELGKWADSQPGGEAIHDALFRAYFVDCLNIGDPAVWCGLPSVGCPATRLVRSPTLRSHQAAVVPTGRNPANGVTGVLTFVAGGYGVG